MSRGYVAASTYWYDSRGFTPGQTCYILMCVKRMAQYLRPRSSVGMAFVNVEQLIAWKFPSLKVDGEVRGIKEER